MSLLKRVFSTDYRRALASEATGDYVEAAKSYALAGEPVKVGQMHLLAAERAAHTDGRISSLRTAARWAAGDSEEARALRGRIARAILVEARANGQSGDRGSQLLLEAAELFASAGDHAGAGECLELAGDEAAAAAAYQQAGEVERLEGVLEREAQRRTLAAQVREAYANYEMQLGAGARDEALASLETCLALAPDGATHSLAAMLRARIVRDGAVTLRGDSADATRYVGRFPVGIGRDEGAEVPLRDGRVSRRHAELCWSRGRFEVRDCDSRNGTLLDGRALERGQALPLGEKGEIALGESVLLAYTVRGGRVDLVILRGADRGLGVSASLAPMELAEGALVLRFDHGRPMLRAVSERRLLIGGVRTGPEVQLVRDDRIELEAGAVGEAPICLVVQAPG